MKESKSTSDSPIINADQPALALVLQLKDQIAARRRSMRNQIIGRSLVLLLLAAVLSYLAIEVSRAVKYPSWMAIYLEERVGAELPGLLTNAEQVARHQASLVAANLEKEINRSIGRIRREGARDIAADNRFLVQSINDSFEIIFEEIIQENKKLIAALLREKGDASKLKELEDAVIEQLTLSYLTLVGKREEISFTDLLIAASGKVHALATKEEPSAEEQLERLLLVHLFKFLNTPTPSIETDLKDN